MSLSAPLTVRINKFPPACFASVNLLIQKNTIDMACSVLEKRYSERIDAANGEMTMNRTLKQLLGTLSVVTLAVVGLAPAHAASTWYANSGTCAGVGDGSTGANTCQTATTADGSAKVSAWANTGTSGAYETAVLTRWDGGFGVKNRCATDIAGGVCGAPNYGDAGETGEPEHAIDNNEYRDMVLFDFGAASIALNSLTIGYRNNDSDIQVYAWTGGGTPVTYGNAAGTTGSLAAGWQLVSSLNDVATWGTPGFNKSGSIVYSSWWLIAPGTVDSNADHFKLYSVSGDKKPPVSVSEPGALALAGLGLLGAFVSARRRRA